MILLMKMMLKNIGMMYAKIKEKSDDKGTAWQHDKKGYDKV